MPAPIVSTVPPPSTDPSDARDPVRRIARTAGVLYLITFVSIPTLVLYGPVHEAGFVTSAGSNTGVIVGGLLEVVVALAGIGTAVVLFSVLRRQDEPLALGFVATRTVEAASIFLGVTAIFTLVTLRRGDASGDPTVIGDTLVAVYDRTFLLGQNLMPVMNALLLGTLLYRSRLVPRWIPTLGLVGAPLLLATQLGVLAGLYDRTSPVTALGALPIAAWELSLGLCLVTRGFSAPAVRRLAARPYDVLAAARTHAT